MALDYLALALKVLSYLDRGLALGVVADFER